MLTNSKSKLQIGKINYRPNEIWKMQADNKFVINKIKWKPNVSFQQGLKKSQLTGIKDLYKIILMNNKSYLIDIILPNFNKSEYLKKLLSQF